MFTKFVVSFCVLALAAAVAGSVPTKAQVYRLTLTEPAQVSGVALQAGEYKVTVNGGTATFTMGKESHDVAVTVEAAAKKFEDNQIQFEVKSGKRVVTEISLGGSKTRLRFN